MLRNYITNRIAETSWPVSIVRLANTHTFTYISCIIVNVTHYAETLPNAGLYNVTEVGRTVPRGPYRWPPPPPPTGAVVRTDCSSGRWQTAAMLPSARETLSTTSVEAPGALTDMLVTGMGQLGANGLLEANTSTRRRQRDYTVHVSIGGSRRRAARRFTRGSGAAPRPPGTQLGGMVQTSLTNN